MNLRSDDRANKEYEANWVVESCIKNAKKSYLIVQQKEGNMLFAITFYLKEKQIFNFEISLAIGHTFWFRKKKFTFSI